MGKFGKSIRPFINFFERDADGARSRSLGGAQTANAGGPRQILSASVPRHLEGTSKVLSRHLQGTSKTRPRSATGRWADRRVARSKRNALGREQVPHRGVQEPQVHPRRACRHAYTQASVETRLQTRACDPLLTNVCTRVLTHLRTQRVCTHAGAAVSSQKAFFYARFFGIF